jgi:hypothetical protein
MRVFAWRHVLAITVALALATNGKAHAGTTVYAAVAGNNPTTEFGTIDLTTGQFAASATLPQFISSLTTGTDGTIFGGNQSGQLYTIEGGGLTQLGSGLFGFNGLANWDGNGFLTYFVRTSGFGLLNVASDGKSESSIGFMGNFPVYGPGNLAFGPDGNLYFDASLTFTGNQLLFRVNTAHGGATPIGTGLGIPNTDGLSLVTAGGQLYGIDNSVRSGSGPIGIYTIDTTTGVATATGVDVSGVPSGFLVYAAATVVPEPTSLTLAATSIAIGLGILWSSGRQKRGQERI